MNVLISILAIVVMIILHEYGHFLAARICKVPVYEFAVGFGPKLISKKSKKGTLWSIRAIPLGGFCAFDDISKDGTVNGITDIALERIPIYKKIFICAMGPIFNILLGFIICVICVFSFGVAEYKNVVRDFSENKGDIAEYIEIGDELIEIDGLDISGVNESTLADYLTNDFKGGKAHVTVIKHDTGNIEEYDITPVYDEETERYYLGFKLTCDYRTPGVVEGLVLSTQETWGFITSVFDSLGGLFTGKYSIKETTGIVGVVSYMSETAAPDMWESWFILAAFISVNLGVMNLLPIPPLDGFKIVQGVIEKIFKKKMNEKVTVIVTTVSFGLIIILSIILAVGDINRIINGGFFK